MKISGTVLAGVLTTASAATLGHKHKTTDIDKEIDTDMNMDMDMDMDMHDFKSWSQLKNYKSSHSNLESPGNPELLEILNNLQFQKFDFYQHDNNNNDNHKSSFSIKNEIKNDDKKIKDRHINKKHRKMKCKNKTIEKITNTLDKNFLLSYINNFFNTIYSHLSPLQTPPSSQSHSLPMDDSEMNSKMHNKFSNIFRRHDMESDTNNSADEDNSTEDYSKALTSENHIQSSNETMDMNMEMSMSNNTSTSHGHSHMSPDCINDPSLCVYKPTHPSEEILSQAPNEKTKKLWSTYDATSYISWPENHSSLLAHFVFLILAWAFVYPISVALDTASSPFYYPVISSFIVLHVLSSIIAIGYLESVPDLYKGNIYTQVMSISTIILFFYLTMVSIKGACRLFGIKNQSTSSSKLPKWKRSLGYLHAPNRETYALHPLSGSSPQEAAAAAAMESSHSHSTSLDSGHGAFSPTTTQNYTDLPSHNDDLYNSPSGSNTPGGANDDNLSDDFDFESDSYRPIPFEYRLWNKLESRLSPFIEDKTKLPYKMIDSFAKTSQFWTSMLTRPLILLGFFQIATAFVVFYGMGKGSGIFNLLAHFIKGGVFFVYGIFSLCKALGCFADLGWSWNIKPPANPGSWASRIPNIEMVESSLIFTYGISNVFLEHLGNTDGIWSHKDLQHVSIAFMYIGGGLCGILYESKATRKMLNMALYSNGIGSHTASTVNSPPVQYAYSFNPFPLFVVFWTGILMSMHAQPTLLSTSIHMQWGYMFSIGSIFRLLTYVTLYISPPTSYLPSRPITEVIASFTVICGGLVFMLSNTETVNGMLRSGLDAMFTLNVTVGISALIIAWIMVVLTVKGWAFSRVNYN